MEADIDATVSLSCDVDGNPTPDIFWVHQANERVSSNFTYNLSVPTRTHLFPHPSIAQLFKTPCTIYINLNMVGEPTIYTFLHQPISTYCITICFEYSRQSSNKLTNKTSATKHPTARVVRGIQYDFPSSLILYIAYTHTHNTYILYTMPYITII